MLTKCGNAGKYYFCRYQTNMPQIRKKVSLSWVNKEIKTKLFRRNFLQRKVIKSKDENYWKLYKSSRNAADIAMRNAKREFYATQFVNHNKNPKQAWKTINDILRRNHKQNNVNEIKLPDKTVTSTEELVFNDHFTNIGPKLAETIKHDKDCSFRDFIAQQESTPGFSFQPVNEAKVYKLISKLSGSKATGIDKISANVLLAAAPAITQSLTKIFNMSIVSEQFLTEWKTARIIPVFKKGRRFMLDNYRPISILPVVSKLMEKILYDQMLDHLVKENLLSEHQ